MREEENKIESVHAVDTGIWCQGYRIMLEFPQPSHRRAVTALKRAFGDVIDEKNNRLGI